MPEPESCTSLIALQQHPTASPPPSSWARRGSFPKWTTKQPIGKARACIRCHRFGPSSVRPKITNQPCDDRRGHHALLPREPNPKLDRTKNEDDELIVKHSLRDRVTNATQLVKQITINSRSSWLSIKKRITQLTKLGWGLPQYLQGIEQKRFFTIMPCKRVAPRICHCKFAVTVARRGAEREPQRALLRTVRRHPWFGTVHGGPCPRDTRRARTRLARLTDLARRPTTHRPWWWCTPQVLEVLNSVPGAGSWSFNDRLNLYQLYYGDGNGDGGFVNDPIAHP